MVSKPIEDPALSANLGSGDVRRIVNRNSSQKTNLAAAYLGRGSMKSPGYFHLFPEVIAYSPEFKLQCLFPF